MLFNRRLIALLKQVPRAYILTLVMGLLNAGLAIVLAWVLTSVLNAVFLDGQRLQAQWGWLAVLAAAAIGRAGVQYIGQMAAKRGALAIKAQLRSQVMAHVLKLGPVGSRQFPPDELTTLTVQGVEALDAYFSQYLPQFAFAVIQPAIIFLFVLPLDWVSAAVLLVTAPLIPVFLNLIGTQSQKLADQQWLKLSFLGGYFLDLLRGLPTLQLYNQSKGQIGQVSRVTERFRQATHKVMRISVLSALVLELLTTLSTAVVAVQVGLRLLYGQMEFSPAFFILLIAPEFYLPLRQFGARFHAAQSARLAAEQIFKVLDTQPQTAVSALQISKLDKINLKPVPPPDPVQTAEVPLLKVENIWYTYPGGTYPALRGVNLTVKPEQLTVVVGASGAGKSTLMDVLLRFIVPQVGRVYLTGREMREINLTEWRSQFVWIPQEPYLFNDTIAANLRFAWADANEADLWMALRTAQLATDVKKLPLGLETPLGEGGARLSRGQGQRLALARALLKPAPIVLMDEPTSHLDPENEDMLNEVIRQLSKTRSVVMIAHRLNTVYRADQVLVLEGGRAAECGNHATLLARQGVYTRMMRTWEGQ